MTDAATTELAMLVWTVALCGILWVPYILARMMVWGLVDTVGYPDNPPPLPGWAQRAQRTHLNLVENLAVFAPLVLIVHVTGTANEVTAFAASLFFWARIAHAVIFIARIPWLRTLAFLAGFAALVILFVELVRAGIA